VKVVEAQAAIKGKGALVLLGHGEGELGEAASGEIGVAVTEKMLADARTTVFGEGADLGNVPYIVTHTGTE